MGGATAVEICLVVPNSRMLMRKSLTTPRFVLSCLKWYALSFPRFLVPIMRGQGDYLYKQDRSQITGIHFWNSQETYIPEEDESADDPIFFSFRDGLTYEVQFMTKDWLIVKCTSFIKISDTLFINSRKDGP